MQANFRLENLEGRHHFEELGADRRITLKLSPYLNY
jgi:hypothetical protein